MSVYTEMVKNWAENPYITHEDVNKCGLCLQQKIQSDVAKEFLETHQEVTQEDLKEILFEVKKEWRETALYKRVQALLETGKTLEEIEKELLLEGIEI